MIDYRIYDPDHDGKTKFDHVRDMLNQIVDHKQLPFHAVLMDTWYATKELMLYIDSLHKIFYCPHSKTTAKSMIQAVKASIAGLIPLRGAITNGHMASSSKSKVFPKTTK